MLDCTGDTDCKVNLRANRLTGLADLERLRLPACIDNRTGAGNLSAENLCELVENLEVLCAAHTAAAGDQDLRVHDVDRIADLLHDLEDVHIAVVRLEARVELDKLKRSAVFLGSLLHNTGANRSHLRTVVRASDRRDRVAAECRTGHEKLVVLLGVFLACRNGEREVADLELRAVCRKAGLNTRRGARAEIAADCGSTNQNDLRLELIDDLGECVRVRLGSVVLELRIVDQNDAVCAVSAELFRFTLDTGTDQNRSHFRVQLLCEVLALTDQFVCNIADFAVHLLGKDIYALVLF